MDKKMVSGDTSISSKLEENRRGRIAPDFETLRRSTTTQTQYILACAGEKFIQNALCASNQILKKPRAGNREIESCLPAFFNAGNRGTDMTIPCSFTYRQYLCQENSPDDEDLARYELEIPLTVEKGRHRHLLQLRHP